MGSLTPITVDLTRMPYPLWISLILVVLGVMPSAVRADEPKPDPERPTHSWGALDHWCDQFVCSDWRIQTNVVTRRCRLLNDRDARVAAGDFETCKAVFERERASGKVPPMKPDVVVCLHGLARSRDSMKGLVERLNQTSEFTAINFGYSSTAASLDEHASALECTLQSLEGARTIHFVAHSMGNIVVRRMMARQLDSDGKIDPRIGRMVMLGPPNQGAQLANITGDGTLLGLVLGPAAKQLGPQWVRTELKLTTPPIEFAIVAGGSSTGGFSPLLPGDDDFVVRVAETKLPGAADYRVLPVHHAGVRDPKYVGEMTVQFLKNGYLESPEKRQRIGQDGLIVTDRKGTTRDSSP